MEILNASDAKREFGEVLLKAQKAPVGINRNGKPVAVMVSASEYERIETLKETYLKAELAKGLASLEKGDLLDGERVFNELEAQIGNASV